MKLPRSLLPGLLPGLFLALLGLANAPAHAAAAVAVGDGNYTYTVVGYDDIEEAKAEALKKCAQEASNCQLSVWTAHARAIALAKGKGGMFSMIAKTAEAAREGAMAGCRKSYKGCEFSALYWEPGGPWSAWAYAQDEQDKVIGNYFVTESGTEAEAKKDAVAGCEEQQTAAPKKACTVLARRGVWGLASVRSKDYLAVYTGLGKDDAVATAMENCRKNAPEPGRCKLESVFANPAEQAKPKSFDKVYAASVMARDRRAEARPAQTVRTSAVRQLTCQNSCVNGSCVRTFADGRKERWQAPRVFDPLTNDWKWETNSCGG